MPLSSYQSRKFRRSTANVEDSQSDSAAAAGHLGEPQPSELTALPTTPSPPALASKADDLEAIRSAVVDAAGVSAGLWLSYLFVLFYLLVAASGVTHRDLFFASPVKLPFLNVDLPLKGFFWVGPTLFLIVHAYVLLHFVLLASKAGVFDVQLRAQIGDPDVRAQLRRQLPINIFVQFLAGPQEVRRGIMGFLLRLIAWISLVIGPVALLVFFQLQFLPYHDEWTTWWQRITLLLDLGLLWVLWPAVARGEAIGPAWRSIGWSNISIMACVSLVSVPLVFAIATFPGEWLEKKVPTISFLPPSFSPRRMLVAGEVDQQARKPKSLWSNTLVLPGLDAVDTTKSGSEGKAVREIASLRKRHLEHAVLIGALLRKVDFTGANLEGAALDNAQLKDAVLDYVQLEGASLLNAQLQGASLRRAQLAHSVLMNADFRGSSLDHARLNNSVMSTAHLQGAMLDHAQLREAILDSAEFQGATLIMTQLQEATLYNANFQGAILIDTQLQGAVLDGAQLQGGLLRHVFAWRADSRKAHSEGARIEAVETDPKKMPCAGRSIDACDQDENSEDRLFKLEEVPEPQRKPGLRLERIDPAKPLNGEEEMTAHWIDLQKSTPPINLYEKEVAEQWREIGCAVDGAPHVITRLVNIMSIISASSLGPVSILGKLWVEHEHSRIFISPFSPDSAQVLQLATDFLKEDCAGARGITERTRMRLKALRDHVPQSQ